MYESNVVMDWRRTKKGYYIIGSRCKECSAIFYPVKIKCPKCGSKELEDYKFKGKGKIYSYSTIHYAPTGFEKQVPYEVAMIELDEGPKITAQLVDFDEIKIGMKVESCVRKIFVDGATGIIHYGIKFRPLN
jgi:hypothetical protein